MPVSLRSRAGFTLVEMAVVLMIIATVTGGMLAVMNAQQENSSYITTRNHLDAIENALAEHVEKTGYLPCAAPSNAAEETATFGVSADCSQASAPAGIASSGTGDDTIWIGVVPTRSLNLPDEYMYDGWNNRISYAVIQELATTADAFENYATTATTGVIQIMDYANNQIPNANNKSVIGYALVSHGKDRKGAYGIGGSIATACAGASSKDGTNCDRSDAVFRDSIVIDSTTQANYYDDVVRWKSKDVLDNSGSGASETEDFTAEDRLDNGNYYTCAIDNTATPYCWGNDAATVSTATGRLGEGVTGGVYNNPPGAQVGGASGFTDWDIIKIDWQFSCGIRSGKLYCWGGNCPWGGHPGCLGLNQASGAYTVNTPTQITNPNFTDWAKLDVDGYHACALRSTGALYCWGRNDDGQLGIGSLADVLKPTQVKNLDGSGNFTDWTAVSIGATSSCGLRSNNRAYCWGDNSLGQVGDGTTTDRNLPKEVSGGYADWVYIGGAHEHFCGIRNGNRAYCWGNNADGQLGTGSAGGTSNVPVLVAGGYTNWKKIKTDNKSTCALTYAGEIYCWGDNADGAVGNGAMPTDSYSPTLITGGSSGWIDITHHCGIKSDKKAYCWEMYGNNATPASSPTLIPGLTF